MIRAKECVVVQLHLRSNFSVRFLSQVVLYTFWEATRKTVDSVRLTVEDTIGNASREDLQSQLDGEVR